MSKFYNLDEHLVRLLLSRGVDTQEKLNSTILLFDLGQSLGAASLIFFLSLIKRGFYVLEILLWNFSQWTFILFYFLIGSGKFFESH